MPSKIFITIDDLIETPFFAEGNCGLCGQFGQLRWVDFIKDTYRYKNIVFGTWVDGQPLCLTCRTSGEHIMPGEQMCIWTGEKRTTKQNESNN